MYIVSFRQNDNLEDKDLDDLYNDLRVFEAEDGSNDSILEAFIDSHAKYSLINDDLEQINFDDLEEMDIKWQMAMLTMRTKRFIKRTGRNNFAMRREDGDGFDKSKHESNNQQLKSANYNNRNSSQALVSHDGMGFDWSDQADEAIQNQALMAEVSESSSTTIPTEVKSKLCSNACLETVRKYRDHNQSMCDDLKRLEKHMRESSLIIVNFEEQIKAYQANELQHSYDHNYWKWEKEIEIKLEKAREECEKRGIGYNNTPPPYNNYHIPSTSDLLERQDKKDLPAGATEVDPQDKVVVEVESEEENTEDKNKEDQKEIPLENHILTNERGGGKPFVKTEKVEMSKIGEDNVKSMKVETSRKEKEKQSRQSRNHMADNVITAPMKSHIQNKFAKSKENTPSKSRSNSNNRKANNFVKIWVPNCKKLVSTSISNSTGNRNSTAESNTTVDQVSTAISNSNANRNSTAESNTATSVNSVKPIIMPKYSSHEIPNSNHLIKTKLTEYEATNSSRGRAFGNERQFSAPRTPQQNGVAERSNRILIEAARSLLADSKLPITFWAEAVNTACYVQNKVLASKAYRVFNSSSRINEESDNVKCNENTPNQIGTGPDWLFDIDSLTNSLGFSNVQIAGTSSEKVQAQRQVFVLFPIPIVDPVEFCQQEKKDDSETEDSEPEQDEDAKGDEEDKGEKEDAHPSGSGNTGPEMPTLSEDDTDDEISSVFGGNTPEMYDSNLDANINEEAVNHTRTQKNHPPQLVIGDINSPIITRHQSKLGGLKDLQSGLLSCLLSQIEPKKAYDAMKDSSWIEAMQEELL
ncbi:hypothetical protein L6452_06444 [Arctium lappa]|uniref:Uncharacterized protein n=1 Tax=Arctium lappa TaxID=4217 RepID=A0ACB9EJ57_ARCLA|nr:hypothetical protein L6452_06444 [Arctium lappa]